MLERTREGVCGRCGERGGVHALRPLEPRPGMRGEETYCTSCLRVLSIAFSPDPASLRRLATAVGADADAFWRTDRNFYLLRRARVTPP